MAEGKKGFVLYADLIYTVEKLPNDKAGELFKHILRYVNDLNPTTEDLIIQLSFEPVKQQLKRDLVKYESIREKRSFAGKKSAESKQQTSTNSTSVESVEQTSTNSTVIVTDKDIVTVIDNVTDTVNDILLKKETKRNIFSFQKKLIEYGFDENLVNDWLIVRKNKKASNTETAFKAFISEIESRSCNINEMLLKCVENSWSGFKHTWVDNLNQKNLNQNGKQQKSNTEIFATAMQSDAAKNFRF